MSSFGTLELSLGNSVSEARLLFDVAVNDLSRVAALFQTFFYFLRQHYGVVFSPRATKRDGQVAFPFADVVRNQIGKQTLHSPQELPSLRKGTDVLADLRVLACVGS